MHFSPEREGGVPCFRFEGKAIQKFVNVRGFVCVSKGFSFSLEMNLIKRKKIQRKQNGKREKNYNENVQQQQVK